MSHIAKQVRKAMDAVIQPPSSLTDPWQVIGKFYVAYRQTFEPLAKAVDFYDYDDSKEYARKCAAGIEALNDKEAFKTLTSIELFTNFDEIFSSTVKNQTLEGDVSSFIHDVWLLIIMASIKFGLTNDIDYFCKIMDATRMLQLIYLHGKKEEA